MVGIGARVQGGGSCVVLFHLYQLVLPNYSVRVHFTFTVADSPPVLFKIRAGKNCSQPVLV